MAARDRGVGHQSQASTLVMTRAMGKPYVMIVET